VSVGKIALSLPLRSVPAPFFSFDSFFVPRHSFGDNFIGDEGAAAIGEALAYNKTLTVLR
jgi:hypothetical protein